MIVLFRLCRRLLPLFVIAQLCVHNSRLSAQERVQCFSLEFFYDSSVNDASGLRADLQEFAEERTGLSLNFYDVKQDADAQKKLESIAKYFGMSEVKLPAIYGLKNILADVENEKQMRSRLEQILTVTAYVRDGCPHCNAAKEFLHKYDARYPALKFVYKEVIRNPSYHAEMEKVTERYRQRVASLPVIHYCNGLTIGFDREATTGRRILQTLDYWSHACTVEKKN